MSDPAAIPEEPGLSVDAADGSPPARSGFVSSLRDGLQIARWDGEAVERVSRNPRALLHGACFTIIGTLLAGLPDLLGVGQEPTTTWWPFLLFGLIVAGALQLVISAIATGVVHGGAKLLFGGSGTYVRLLRVLWVGSVVSWVALIPLVGPIVSNVLYLLVALIAISDVEEVERLQALMLVVGLRALTFLAALLLR
jgi:hypothetical protein